MDKSRQYYDKTKHKDSWGIDVVYPDSVAQIIELAQTEGILIGLSICKKMWGEGTISHESIRENEIYYSELLESEFKDAMKE